MYYKDNSTANGWFPRPVMPAQCKQWKKSFIADGENQGVATQVQANACNEKGNRQAWHYDVTATMRIFAIKYISRIGVGKVKVYTIATVSRIFF